MASESVIVTRPVFTGIANLRLFQYSQNAVAISLQTSRSDEQVDTFYAVGSPASCHLALVGGPVSR